MMWGWFAFTTFSTLVSAGLIWRHGEPWGAAMLLLWSFAWYCGGRADQQAEDERRAQTGARST